MLIDQVYYINIDSFTDRREYMEAQFNREFILAERFSAFYPGNTPIKQLVDSELVSNQVFVHTDAKTLDLHGLENLFYSAGESKEDRGHLFTLYTAASHAAIWRKVAEMPPDSNILIFEDDVMFLVNNIWEELHKSLEHLPKDYDISFFAYWLPCLTPINEYFSVPTKEKGKCNLWTNCYLISQKGAKKLLDMFIPYSRTSGIDVDMRERYDEINVYFSNKPFATQRRDILRKAGHPNFVSARDAFSNKLEEAPKIVTRIPLRKKMNYISSSIYCTGRDPMPAGYREGNEFIIEPDKIRVDFWNQDVMADWHKSGEEVCRRSNDLRLLVFYDRMPDHLVEKYNTKYTTLIKVPECGVSCPYDYRWQIYLEFMENNYNDLGGMFFTDICDVIIKQDPFPHVKDGVIYVGDQPEPWGCRWAKNKAGYYMNKFSDFMQIYNRYVKYLFLNAGIAGGKIDVIKRFVGLMHEHIQCTLDKAHDMGDMMIFNYILHKYFPNKKHGRPVNSIFWMDQRHRTDVWFVHK